MSRAHSGLPPHGRPAVDAARSRVRRLAPRLALAAAVIAGSAVATALPAAADSVPPAQTAAPATLVVHADQPFRAVTHVASGSLYGLDTATVPAGSLVTSLHPNTFVQMAPGGHQLPNGEPAPGGDALVVAPEAARAGAKVVVRMPDWYPNFPYRWVSWSDWLSAVDTQVKSVLAAGAGNIRSFELWNEPDWTWNTAAAGPFDAGWARTFDEVRADDPAAVIQGPSISTFNLSWMTTFLTDAKASGTVPDIISWHELGGSASIPGDVAAYRTLESSLGISPRPIAIEEYGTPSEVGVPGPLAGYIAKFERAGVDNAELAFWNHYGTLGDLLTDTGGQPNGAYWLYDWYGAMTGSMVTTVPPAAAGLDGAAAVNAAKNEVDVIAGGGSGATAVQVTGLDRLALGKKVNVALQYTPSAGRTTAVAGPVTISDATYRVANGTVTVPIAMNASYGYHIVITPQNDHAVTTLKGTYHLTNLGSGLALDTTGDATASGTPADQSPASTSMTQLWTLKAAGSGLYTITNKASGLLLGVSGQSAGKGAPALITGTAATTPDRLWQVIPDGSGHDEIANYNSGLVLTLAGASTASGAPVVQWPDDQVSNSCNATGPRVAGKIGNAVSLCGNGEYVSLPNGIVSGLAGDYTVSAWVNPSANTTWSRIFDIGTGTGDYMFLTVSDGAEPRFAITTGGAGAEQQIKGTGLLPLNTWSLVTVTLSGTTGTLYVDGTPVGSNTSMTVHPSALGTTTQSWIGRSEYGDPYYSGAVDDFNIYNRALSAAEVATLATGVAGAGDVADYKFDEAGGATAVDSSGNGRNATIISRQATVNFGSAAVNDQWWTLVPKR